MDWKTKVMWLKRNPVTVVRQIDHIFRQVFGKVMFSGMHPVGVIINFDAKNEYQNRGPQHPHFFMHVEGAPIINENEDIEVERFIDKYISCSLPSKTDFPELHELVETVQTHHHTFTC